MVSFRRFLSLAVVLMLALPAVATADPGITVQSISTDKASYAPGDTVQFSAEVSNALGGWQLAQGHCSASGFPVCLSISTSPSFFSDGQSADFPPGLSTWTWSATAPAAPGTYSVTVQAWDGFYGNFGTLAGSFTVGQASTPPGAVTVPATAPWVNTGVDVHASDTLSISASGTWTDGSFYRRSRRLEHAVARQLLQPDGPGCLLHLRENADPPSGRAHRLHRKRAAAARKLHIDRRAP